MIKGLTLTLLAMMLIIVAVTGISISKKLLKNLLLRPKNLRSRDARELGREKLEWTHQAINSLRNNAKPKACGDIDVSYIPNL
jgi:hypothetical protein